MASRSSGANSGVAFRRQRLRAQAGDGAARERHVGNLRAGALLEELFEEDRARELRPAGIAGVHLHDDCEHRRLRRLWRKAGGRGARCVGLRHGFEGGRARRALDRLEEVGADAGFRQASLDRIVRPRVVPHRAAPMAAVQKSHCKARQTWQCARSPQGTCGWEPRVGARSPHAVLAAFRPSAACAAARRAIGMRNGEHDT